MVAPHTADEVKTPVVTRQPESLDLFDHVAPAEDTGHFDNVVTPGSSELAAELDAAAQWLGVTIGEILLAALGRTFGRTRGDGVVCVDVLDGHRRRTRPVALLCAASLPMGPTEMLQGAHNVLVTGSGQPAGPSQVVLEVAAGPVDPSAPDRALELRIGWAGGADAPLELQWWYDAARLDRYSVEEMAQQFPLALIEITSDAGAPL